jgi:membrane protein DedA with SNARE-associated domain
MSVFDELSRFLRDNYAHHEFVLLFLVTCVEMMGIPLPLPSDSFIFLAGTHQGRTFGYFLAVLAITMVGAVCGASVLFFLMQHGGRHLLEKYGKFILLNKKRLKRFESTFQHWGHIAIIAGWIIPGLRIPTIIISGLSGMSYGEFLPFAVMAAFLWSMLYFWLGAIVGAQSQHILSAIGIVAQQYGTLTIEVGIALGFVLLARKVHSSYRSHNPNSTAL